MKKIIFLLSHPIQYFSPLFQQMIKDDKINLSVFYCSDENVKGHLDKEFGVKFKWDIDLLSGYNYKVLKNNSWKPSIFNGFWGLLNFEIIKTLKKERGGFLVIHGWNYATNFLAIVTAKFYGIKLCLRGENPLNQELLKSKNILLLRKIFFKYLFFPLFDYFCYIGSQNKKLYEYYDVPAKKLIFTPYAVDNDRFKAEYEKYRVQKTEIRKELGLPVDKRIILTSGKYIYKKRPMDLLKAFQLLNNDNAALVFLGDGELRTEMENYIKENNLEQVYLTGFKNQTEVGKYSAAADLFVISSGAGETWGLVVNEAMIFGLPIIASDLVGCTADLVIDGNNGFKFKCGDINDLLNKIKLIISDDNRLKCFGKSSIEKIKDYSYDVIIQNIKEELN